MKKIRCDYSRITKMLQWFLEPRLLVVVVVVLLHLVYCEITRSNISSNLRTPTTIITHKILGKILSTLRLFYQGGWPVKRLGSTQRLSQSFVQQQQ